MSLVVNRGRLWFLLALAPLVVSSSGLDCMPTGNTQLATFEIEVDGENRLAFDPAIRVYDVGVPQDATTATVRARSMDPDARVNWFETQGNGTLGVGGGEVTIDLPTEDNSLYVAVLPPGGAVDTYIVSFSPCNTDCSDGDDCTADVCDPATGACENPQAQDGTACEVSGLPGQCVAGLCEEEAACPVLTKVVVTPFLADVGDEISVSASASGPGPINYLWTATAGAFVDPTIAATSYLCEEPGPQSLTISVSDDTTSCDDQRLPQTIPVTCVEADPIDPIPETEMACPEISIGVPPAGLGLDPFYTKYADVGGIPLVSSSAVDDDALRAAFHIASHMLNGLPCVRAAMIEAGVRIGVMANTEVTTDMPEHADLNTAFPPTNWDVRARGLGYTLARPLVSGAEENLIRLAGDIYAGQSIFLHEFSHAFFNPGIEDQADGATQVNRLQAAYLDALVAGVLDGSYASTNYDEYWAVGMQNFFDTNLESSPPNGVYNEVNTRIELLATDPALHDFIAGLLVDEGFTAYCDPTLPREPPVLLPQVDPAACDLRTERLNPDDCGEEGMLATFDTAVPTTIRFVNRTYEPYNVYWLDEQGVRRFYGSVVPRSEGNPVPTFVTQPWVVTSGGACVGIYMPTERDGRVFFPIGSY